jgi:predicted CxxxxCH...CXXCH cytochrome family protein
MGVIMRSIRLALATAAAALALAGCDSPRTGERAAVNCTGCHGQQVASFDAETDLAKAAPPVGTRGGTRTTDLDVGQHQAHLNTGPFALGFACETCHVVPTDDGHADEPVVVTLQGAGQTLLPANLGRYDATAHTCDTYCHGSDITGGTLETKPPSWTQSFSNCDACHGLPSHIGSDDLTTCATCHPDTMSSDGTLNVAGGKHVNGHIDLGHLAEGYGDPASPAFHGSDALAYLQQQAGARDCASCHGPGLDGDAGPSCEACHASTASVRFPAGVAEWKTNCTFCHGTPTEPFTYASQLANAAPPDDVIGRLTGTSTASKTGAHQVHLAGSAVAPAFACATCHPVPAQATPLEHLVGGTVQVALVGAGQAYLPSSLGTYSLGRCSVYCHNPPSSASGTVGGSSPAWSGSGYACNACHGNGSDARNYWPATGRHENHCSSAPGGNVRCYYCHSTVVTNVDPSSTPAIADLALHVNGAENVQFGDGTVTATINNEVIVVSGTWNGTSCSVSCHANQSRTW